MNGTFARSSKPTLIDWMIVDSACLALKFGSVRETLAIRSDLEIHFFTRLSVSSSLWLCTFRGGCTTAEFPIWKQCSCSIDFHSGFSVRSSFTLKTNEVIVRQISTLISGLMSDQFSL